MAKALESGNSGVSDLCDTEHWHPDQPDDEAPPGCRPRRSAMDRDRQETILVYGVPVGSRACCTQASKRQCYRSNLCASPCLIVHVLGNRPSILDSNMTYSENLSLTSILMPQEDQQCAESTHRPCGKPSPVYVLSMAPSLVCDERDCWQEDRRHAYGRGRT